MIPVIFSLQGPTLTASEADFFSKVQPLGFILFERNLAGQNPDEIRSLIADLKGCIKENDRKPLITVDLEGGRVNRLFHLQYFPSSRYFGDLSYLKDIEFAKSSLRKNIAAVATLLKDCGFNSVCAPDADLYHRGITHKIIGERSYGSDINTVISLSRVAVEVFTELGVHTIVKHLPGHGCVSLDSHKVLPEVPSNFSLQFLYDRDFRVFKELSDCADCAMLSHIVYPFIDAQHPASQSRLVIDYVRKELGFVDVQLCSDDISMAALAPPKEVIDSSGYDLAQDFAARTKMCLQSGCNFVFECSGQINRMKGVAEGCRQYQAMCEDQPVKSSD